MPNTDVYCNLSEDFKETALLPVIAWNVTVGAIYSIIRQNFKEQVKQSSKITTYNSILFLMR